MPRRQSRLRKQRRRQSHWNLAHCRTLEEACIQNISSYPDFVLSRNFYVFIKADCGRWLGAALRAHVMGFIDQELLSYICRHKSKRLIIQTSSTQSLPWSGSAGGKNFLPKIYTLDALNEYGCCASNALLQEMKQRTSPVLFMDKKWNDDSFVVPYVCMMEQKYHNYIKNWKKISILVAFYRANHNHRFRSSILSLLPFIARWF